MYSWNMYLGTDFYSAMGYYCTGDIFLPLLLLFRNNVEYGLIAETILCFYISANMMYILLKKLGIKQILTLVFIPLIYSFGGFTYQFVENYMFFRFYAFLPLIFIGFLSYLENKKKSTFIVGAAILFLQSFYLMFPTLIFLFLFAVMVEIKNNKTINEFLKDFFVLLGCLIVGYLISAVITLPSIMYTLNNSRVRSNEAAGFFWQRNVYAGLYVSLISYIPWVIDNIFKTTNGGHDNFYSLFVTIIPFVSCIGYVSKKENKNELYLLIILIIIACTKPMSSLMHGFSQPSLRWTFLLQFYILILAALGMEKIDTKSNNIIFIIYILGFLLQFYFLYKNNWIDYWNVQSHLNVIYISISLCLLIFVSFKFNKEFAILLSVPELVCFLSYDLYLRTF